MLTGLPAVRKRRLKKSEMLTASPFKRSLQEKEAVTALKMKSQGLVNMSLKLS
jgi:hypothetical protein